MTIQVEKSGHAKRTLGLTVRMGCRECWNRPMSEDPRDADGLLVPHTYRPMVRSVGLACWRWIVVWDLRA